MTDRYVSYDDGRQDLHFQLDMCNPYEGLSFMKPLTNEEKSTHQETTFVGVAYQITSLGNLDTAYETMSIGIEISMLFRVLVKSSFHYAHAVLYYYTDEMRFKVKL